MSTRLDVHTKERCSRKLVQVAREGTVITYGDLGAHLGIRNVRNGLSGYLDAVCDDEIHGGRPDVTVVVVNKRTRLGRFNTPEAINPNDQRRVAEYKAALAQVHRYWKQN